MKATKTKLLLYCFVLHFRSISSRRKVRRKPVGTRGWSTQSQALRLKMRRPGNEVTPSVVPLRWGALSSDETHHIHSVITALTLCDGRTRPSGQGGRRGGRKHIAYYFFPLRSPNSDEPSDEPSVEPSNEPLHYYFFITTAALFSAVVSDTDSTSRRLLTWRLRLSTRLSSRVSSLCCSGVLSRKSTSCPNSFPLDNEQTDITTQRRI